MKPETSLPFYGKYPRSPIPPVLMVSEADSFAQYTIRERLPAILRQILSDNAFSQLAMTQLELLKAELPDGVIRLIQEDGGSDIAAWSSYGLPFQGHSWLNLPFFFAEAYFYRRILEAIAYFQAEPHHRPDPFARQKHLSLETASDAILAIVPSMNSGQQTSVYQDWQTSDLIRLLDLALWGNRVDLSLWSARETSRIRTEVEQDKEHILVNHSQIIASRVSHIKRGRFDLVLDNAGFELICDLILVDFLLSTQIAATIYLHLKPYPLFVSDATVPDIRSTLTWLTAHPNEAVQAFAARLQHFMASDRLLFQTDFFWAAPLPFWEMPLPLRQELSNSQLILVKGDANYRRLIGDCHWSFTTPLEEIANYFPAPLVALRTLKSEVMTGLQPEQVERLSREDPRWLINGQWGVVQFVDSSQLSSESNGG